MANASSPKNSGGREGYSLVAVLVFCLILMPVIATFSQSARTTARTTHNSLARNRLEFLAAGLADAIAFKAAADRKFYRKITEKSLHCRYNGLTIVFAIEDHDGKIDINNAGGILLRAGFRAGGASKGNAEILQQYAEAYRSGQELPANLSDARSLPSLKGAAFERVEEIYDAVEALKLPPVDLTSIFTVYRKAANVELDTASASLQKELQNDPATQEFTASDNGTFEFVDIIVGVAHPSGLKIGATKTYRGGDGGRVAVIARDYGIPDDIVNRLTNSRPVTDCMRLLGLKLEGVHNASAG